MGYHKSGEVQACMDLPGRQQTSEAKGDLTMGDNSISAIKPNITAPPQTYVNQRGLTADNLVYVAGEGRNVVAADREVGVDGAHTGPFVETSTGELGIYHRAMMNQFRSRHTPSNTGNAQADQSKDDFAFCNFATKKYEEATDEVFRLLKSQPPEQQEQTRAFLKEVDEKATAEAQRLGLSPGDTKEYKNQQMFKAVGDRFKGTALGDRSREAYALGNYSLDALKFTSAKYGMPLPGEQNPYNAQGQQYNDYSNSIQDPAILEQIQRLQILQFLTMISLFNNCGMGMYPAMMNSWMR